MAVKTKLKAASLLEALIAMVIITLSLGFGTMILSGILSASPLHERTRALHHPAPTMSTEEYKGAPGIAVETKNVFDSKGTIIHTEKRLVLKKP